MDAQESLQREGLNQESSGRPVRWSVGLPCVGLLVIFANLTACTVDVTEGPRRVRTYTIEQFLATTSVGGGAFSSEEDRLLVHSNATGIFNVYSIEIATGEMTRLTDSQDTTYSVAYLPDSESFLFSRDRGGDELYKLYVQEDGSARQLTRGENTRELFYGFAHDHKSFFTGNNSRDPRFMDVYEWSVETLEPILFYRNDRGLDLQAVSRDKRWLALLEIHNDFDSDMYLVDREGDGVPVRISEVEGEINHYPAVFTPDGSKLLYLTDKDSDFRYVMSHDLESGAREIVFKPEKWDVQSVEFSHHGTYRAIAVNEHGIPRQHIVNVSSGEELSIAGRPEGRLTGLWFSRGERYLRFHAGRADQPPNLYVYDIENTRVRRLTDNLNPEIHPEDLVEPELIALTARDGLEFNGYLYKPHGAGPEHRAPALLWIHGGPGGQSVPAWNAELQFLVNHGYAIFDLNYRGSGGFGREFSMADDQKHGIDAKNWLIREVDWVDSEKIGILGGSYGGYMVMAALAFTPDEFAVGVNIFGVTNWVRTLRSIPPWWESFRDALYREIGNPETQEEMLYEISPLFHADRIQSPVIILQGANDPRVLKVESDEMVENIRGAGGTAEYVLFEDEGHGFTKTRNRIEGWIAILDFLDGHLAGKRV
jgi:dipeptidyl aminopeptidase/acylaminoacyl peptidase